MAAENAVQFISPSIHEGIHPQCPVCGSLAVNRYGRSYSGKQRYICLMCGRQFLPGWERSVVRHRALCPVCKQPMYRYSTYKNFVRFRCSQYPYCHTYVKRDRDMDETVEGVYREMS